jgi:tripartite-type tricarboxylate transporter receptor subunit TctC
MAAPAKTPADRINRLQKAVSDALKQPDVKQKLAQLGVDPVADSPAQFGAFIQSETNRWAKVIQDANIKM